MQLVGGRLEAELVPHASQAGRKHLGVGTVTASLRGCLMMGVPGEHVVGIVLDRVRREDRPERLAQTGLPVDERPIAVEGQCGDVREVDRLRHPRNCSRCAIVGSGMRTKRMTTKRALAAILLATIAFSLAACAGAASSARPSPSDPRTGGPVTTEADAVAWVIAAEPRFAGIGQRDPDMIGQSSWYEAVPASGVGAFLVTMRVGWGDCPAGCTDEHTWLYAVGPDGRVTLQSDGGSAVPDEAWPAPDAGGDVTQGLHIAAVASPTCPVEKMPPDPACAPKPVPNVTVLIADDQGQPQGMVVLDGTGQQSVGLKPGTYTVTAQGASGFMNAPEPQRVVIDAGQVTEVALTYDTGIR